MTTMCGTLQSYVSELIDSKRLAMPEANAVADGWTLKLPC